MIYHFIKFHKKLIFDSIIFLSCVNSALIYCDLKDMKVSYLHQRTLHYIIFFSLACFFSSHE